MTFLKFFLSTILLFNAIQVFAEKIPLGEWHYKLLINGKETGKAVVKNMRVKGNYVSSTKMTMKLGTVISIIEETVTETDEFKPLKLVTYHKVSNDGNTIQENRTVAEVKNNIIILSTGNYKQKIKLNKNFIFDGNYFLSKLFMNKLRPGTEIKANVYIPTIEMDKPIPMKIKIIGMKKIKINDKNMNLLHLKQTIENVKSVDLFMDKNGISHKTKFSILNTKIELVKK